MCPLPVDLRVELLDATLQLLGRAGRGATLPVVGVSMSPSLGEGDRIALRFGVEKPRHGSLLVFRQADSLVVHRYLGRVRLGDGTRGYRMRGDGKIDLDAPVPRERLIGQVRAVCHDGEWWDLQRTTARLYARALAWHDLSWSSAAWVALRFDWMCRRVGWTTGCKELVARLDAGVLGLTHRLLFRRVHARLAEPPQGGAEARLGGLGVGE